MESYSVLVDTVAVHHTFWFMVAVMVVNVIFRMIFEGNEINE
jgi:hypothetical protein